MVDMVMFGLRNICTIGVYDRDGRKRSTNSVTGLPSGAQGIAFSANRGKRIALVKV
jgi:hypothetical protein